jgi:ATP-dependent Clp protease ATP-binding subunit ClpB
VFSDGLRSVDRPKQEVLDHVRSTFRPEFINRIDEIVVFEPLGRDEIARIVDIQLHRLAGRLTDRKLTLQASDGARAYLADKGYDPAFGARPLKRLIQREVQDALAMKMLSGEIREGAAVRIDVEHGALAFHVNGA